MEKHIETLTIQVCPKELLPSVLPLLKGKILNNDDFEKFKESVKKIIPDLDTSGSVSVQDSETSGADTLKFNSAHKILLDKLHQRVCHNKHSTLNDTLKCLLKKLKEKTQMRTGGADTTNMVSYVSIAVLISSLLLSVYARRKRLLEPDLIITSIVLICATLLMTNVIITNDEAKPEKSESKFLAVLVSGLDENKDLYYEEDYVVRAFELCLKYYVHMHHKGNLTTVIDEWLNQNGLYGDNEILPWTAIKIFMTKVLGWNGTSWTMPIQDSKPKVEINEYGRTLTRSYFESYSEVASVSSASSSTVITPTTGQKIILHCYKMLDKVIQSKKITLPQALIYCFYDPCLYGEDVDFDAVWRVNFFCTEFLDKHMTDQDKLLWFKMLYFGYLQTVYGYLNLTWNNFKRSALSSNSLLFNQTEIHRYNSEIIVLLLPFSMAYKNFSQHCLNLMPNILNMKKFHFPIPTAQGNHTPITVNNLELIRYTSISPIIKIMMWYDYGSNTNTAIIAIINALLDTKGNMMSVLDAIHNVYVPLAFMLFHNLFISGWPHMWKYSQQAITDVCFSDGTISSIMRILEAHNQYVLSSFTNHYVFTPTQFMIHGVQCTLYTIDPGKSLMHTYALENPFQFMLEDIQITKESLDPDLHWRFSSKTANLNTIKNSIMKQPISMVKPPQQSQLTSKTSSEQPKIRQTYLNRPEKGWQKKGGVYPRLLFQEGGEYVPPSVISQPLPDEQLEPLITFQGGDEETVKSNKTLICFGLGLLAIILSIIYISIDQIPIHLAVDGMKIKRTGISKIKSLTNLF